MIITRTCYLNLKGVQGQFIPRIHFAEIRKLQKDTLQQRFQLFLKLISFVDSAWIKDYELFDWKKEFDLVKFDKDIDIALSYTNNPAISKGKLLNLINVLSFEFKPMITEKSHFEFLERIHLGEMTVDTFISPKKNEGDERITELVWKSMKVYSVVMPAYQRLTLEDLTDILEWDLPDIPQKMYVAYLEHKDELIKKFRGEFFIKKAILNFILDETSNGAILWYLKELMFTGKVSQKKPVQKVDF